jgi:vesicle-fusing ATPase
VKEVQIEIPLPNKEGRREILQIHFDALRKKGRLSKPLCFAIDGVYNTFSSDEPLSLSASDSNIESSRVVSPKGRKRRAIKCALSQALPDAKSIVHPTYDLAADSSTSGFSGADIAGLVRYAGSLAFSRARKAGNRVEYLLITFLRYADLSTISIMKI